MTTGSTGPNRIFDEFAKLMTDAAGVAQGVKGEAEEAFKSQAERVLNGLDLVKRDEFDAVREMAINALDENDALKAKVEKLEAAIDALSAKGASKGASAKTSTPKKAAAKPAAKKASAKADDKKSKPST